MIRFMKEALQTGWFIVTCGVLLTACAGVDKKDLMEDKGAETTAFGLIKVQVSGPTSRGFPTHLRFFHVVNLNTQERIRVDVKSAAKPFVLNLAPGDYEIVRVQFNEGPMRTESHVSLQFQIQPNRTTYLGTWQFDVDTPRTQRMLRMDFVDEQPNREEISMMHPSHKGETMVVSLPESQNDKVRLYIIPPYPKISFYWR